MEAYLTVTSCIKDYFWALFCFGPAVLFILKEYLDVKYVLKPVQNNSHFCLDPWFVRLNIRNNQRESERA